MAYSEYLHSAYARTRALGIPAETIRHGAGPIPVETLFDAVGGLADLTRQLAKGISTSSTCDVALECATVSVAAKPRFERAIQREIVLTLGSAEYQGIPILSADIEDIQEIRRRANYHVWWSLGAGQIVDMTLMVHLALLKNATPPRILPIIGSPDDIPQIKWRPYLVGSAVLEALTSEPYPVLAR
ncbi:hypothetical protein Q4S45_07765 [Massilia sp. R2A-15]|uniref:hypothetical protein n=1 Tax=Massilia sp. R2A-15 TaxID=3064278 RepID=UPI002734CEA1|nr:hypothetical protein [Massilia sp. R2A-15]WLI91004.1 hypothetical protein Q4S45_07765 [Massilia sp. R2A-15]